MSIEKYCFDGSRRCELETLPTGCNEKGLGRRDKAEYIHRTGANLARIAFLQEQLYAQGRESVILVLQAMDAAGKDSTIKRVMSTVNPQGIDVVSFKQPTDTELAHDYLWRAVQALPTRGKMAIFNRSYYEDVLVVQIHGLHKGYRMARRCLEDEKFFERRYRQIRDFERYLYENSYRVIKIFLNLSKETQKKRFLERIDDPAKNWKFSASDLEERRYWDDYRRVYGEVINATATRTSPWYVLPADQKWYTRWLVSRVVLSALEACTPEYPAMPKEEAARLARCREELLAEE